MNRQTKDALHVWVGSDISGLWEGYRGEELAESGDARLFMFIRNHPEAS